MRRTLRPPAALALIAMVAVTSAGCGGTSSSGISTAGSATTSAGGGTTTATPHTKAVQFAECMRANGVSAFPDPDATGALTIDAVANGSSVDTNSAAFEQALSACKGLEPPGFTGYERSAQQQEGALEFAQCIRDNGVPDFPDPGKDEPLIDTNRIPSANRPGGMDTLHAAMRTCGENAREAGVTGP